MFRGLNQLNKKNQRAQTFIEYALMMGIVILVMMGMRTLITRGGNSMIKLVVDQIGEQKTAEQDFNGSFIQDQFESTTTFSEKKVIENRGNFRYEINEISDREKSLAYNMENG